MKMLLMAVLLLGFQAPAQELDNEGLVTNQQIQMAKDLPATLVMRVDKDTGQVQSLHSKQILKADDNVVKALANADFQTVEANKVQVGELDRDTSRSSWYFYYNYYPQYQYYPYYYNYNYYGNYSSYQYPYYRYQNYYYNYRPYYYSNYGSYGYYFYRWWWY